GGTKEGESLADWQARIVLGRRASLEPWLSVRASPETAGRSVIARSLRYQNMLFGWPRQLARTRNPIFVGLPIEHRAFSMAVASIPYRPVSDALELAALIAGSDLFIGNQSLPCWIAMALGHRLVQESWPKGPNSRIERPNAEFILNAQGDPM